MSVLTLILFFVYTWGLGYTATAFLKNSDNFFERNFMRIGMGVGVFVVLSVILNLLHIPLDWRIFLLISVLYPSYDLIKNREKVKRNFKDIRLTKSNVYILIALILFLFSFYMYHKGAFTYPYLEDDDPWEHARNVKYISIEKTAYEPKYVERDFFRYIDPYPPGYDILMAVLYQTNDSMNWTLKFFNALLISLSIIFFYFFVKGFTRNKDKALIAVFVLTVIPCYLSHFIWVHSIIPLLFFVSFYCLERIDEDRRWFWVSGVVIASIFVVHPSQSIKFVLFFLIYFVVKWIMLKKFPLDYVKSILFGGLLSLSWWATNLTSMFRERTGRITHLDPKLASSDTGFLYKIFSFMKNYFKPGMGTATRPYTFGDFFIAKPQNMINNPIGVGIVLMITLIISVVLVCVFFKKYKEGKRYYIFVALGWLVLTFLMVNSATFNIPGLFAFRTWMLFAIPLSIIVGEGLFLLMCLLKPIGMFRLLVLALFVIGAVFTSGMQKYSVNTAIWPPGAGWTSMDEVQLYLWVGNLQKDTKITMFSGNQNNPVIGLDMANCDWCPENIEFRKGFINKTPDEIYSFLKRNRYKYFILDSMSFETYKEQLGNDTQRIILEKFQEYVNATDKFAAVFQNNGGVILKVL